MNRRFRLITALGIALTLATFTIYIAIKGGDVQKPVLQAAELPKAQYELAKSTTVQVDGIAAGPVKGELGKDMSFTLTDREGKNHIKVEYRGSVPDAFRIGRNVIVTGKVVSRNDKHVFVADPNTLVTKCPSKFESGGGTSRSDG